MPSNRNISTQAVHAGERGPRPDYRPVTTPIYASVGFFYDSIADLDAVFGGTQRGFVYLRYGNPTVAAFEQAVAILESTSDAVAFSSGMAAVHAALLGASVSAGASVVSAVDVYGATYALLKQLFADLDVESQFVDITNLEQVARVVGQVRPVALLCEAISNPLLKVADIPALAQIAHGNGTAVIVDSTFATPVLLRPIEHGADYVVHSATKYLSGHGDVLAGVVACSRERADDLRERQKLLGANLSPHDAWLALRGLKTLALRVREQCLNAQAVAERLKSHPAVSRVHYPGLPEHPQHALAGRLFQSRGFGGVLSFELRAGRQADVFRFMEALELVLPATTLGDIHSLLLYPAHSSHRQMPQEVRAGLGIGENLVRLSVGIEDKADIIADLTQALGR